MIRAVFNLLGYLRHDPVGAFSALIFLLIVLSAIFADLIMPFDPLETNLRAGFQPPNETYLLGADQFGRDLLSRTILATRISCIITSLSLGLTILIAVPVGMLVGYYGGWLDFAVMRFADIVMIFPTIMLAIVLIAILGPSVNGVILALAISATPTFIRVARSVTLSVKNQTYIEAARSVGTRNAKILVSHVLPNILSVIVVKATVTLPAFVLAASSLSYLGLGVQPPMPEWGQMLSEARPYLRTAPHLLIGPGVALFLFVLSSNLLGDTVQEYVNPKLRRN